MAVLNPEWLDTSVFADLGQNWRPSLMLLTRTAGAKGVILHVDQGAEPVLLCDASRCSPEQLKLILTPVAEQLRATLNYTSDKTAKDARLHLKEVFWPNGVLFGLICLYGPTTLSEDARLLRDNLCGRMENDLARQLKQAAVTEVEGAPLTRAITLNDFINSIEDHVWIKDAKGTYVAANHSVVRDWQCSPLGLNDTQLFGPERAALFEAADNQAIRQCRQMVVEECADPGDPEQQTWLETIKSPIIDKQGELLGVIGMTRNVTQRRAFQEQLTLAATVFANSAEGVMITDHRGTIIEVNDAFCRITGYSREEALTNNPRILKSGRHDQGFYEAMWQSMLEQGHWHGELWNRRKDGTLYPQMATHSAVYDDEGGIRYLVALFSDISLQKQTEERLAHMAYHDPLTGLPNRVRVHSQLDQEILRAKRNHSELAVVFIDVDHFKLINDSRGHLVGDEVLCEIAQRLKGQLRNSDTVARIGGDEFVILLPEVGGAPAATNVASGLMSLFQQPVTLSTGEQLKLTGSMGIALYPQDGSSRDTLLRNADTAMYRAKQQGRNSFAFYTHTLTEESMEHLKVQSALHLALERQEFYLVYQPQVDLSSGALVGLEALLRWHSEELGQVSPSRFIPAAERVGLIDDIGLWVLKQACHQGASWLAQGLKFGRLAVNIAGPQLLRDNFVKEVGQVLLESGLPASALELEVTESFMIQNPEESIRRLGQLRNMGIHISIDDFGTGYSSLSYLKRLPLNTLKIDRSFVNGVPGDQDSRGIVEAIISMGHSLSLTVIAEGVESRDQAKFLSDSGCLLAQGFLFSRPLTSDKLTDLLIEGMKS
ncbi:EAL domain-containing protein [Ferrimonas sp. YFM]|uniref:EAL domain-containing protein n=1 Tax=Ferrimonas sp. YFM TaxID=3028878 RepID=UPI00257274DE|nr:EAL domain-containing protein [Ferrimonas sp. YFM]BDY04276.1 GGDEF domain-containing protein [Ferrimonas sp. YFM]